MNFKSKLKTSYKNFIFGLSARNSLIFIAFYRYFYKPEENSIDKFTSVFSRGKGKVTVVQVGANDGINNDPIHKFIRRDNWTGVLLEPQRFVFEKFLQPLYAKTPGITVLNAALDVKDGSKPIYKIAVSESRWATGLSSFNREVLEAAVRSGYIDREAIKEGSPLPVNKEDYIAEEQVECISTPTLVKRFGLNKIDWLQIDTEGFDFEIIRMFDIDVTKPEVIVYENLHFPQALQEECLDYLGNKGYRCRTYGPNTLAMREPVTGFENFFQGK
ncbi:MAG TPA: FkbM family methyltransferase [Bacteroidales bacterium]|nr:FkbM family methyltransferase [Bacteroidales bacterium]